MIVLILCIYVKIFPFKCVISKQNRPEYFEKAAITCDYTWRLNPFEAVVFRGFEEACSKFPISPFRHLHDFPRYSNGKFHWKIRAVVCRMYTQCVSGHKRNEWSNEISWYTIIIVICNNWKYPGRCCYSNESSFIYGNDLAYCTTAEF